MCLFVVGFVFSPQILGGITEALCFRKVRSWQLRSQVFEDSGLKLLRR